MGGEEPTMWPRIWDATRREREHKGEDNKWDGKKINIYIDYIVSSQIPGAKKAGRQISSGIMLIHPDLYENEHPRAFMSLLL